MESKASHQNTNNIKLMESVTKKQIEIVSADNVQEVIRNAFRIASAPRSGAVFVSLPQDVSHQTTDLIAEDIIGTPVFGATSSTQLKQAAELINKAKLPVILLGIEASRVHNTDAIRALLQSNPMPVVSTYQAAGVISKDLLDCFVGRVGLFQNQPGDKLLEAADLVITIGFNSVEYDPEIWNQNKSLSIIHLDYIPADLRLFYSPKQEILGDIAQNIEALTKLLKTTPLDKNPLISELRSELKNMLNHVPQKSKLKIHPLEFIHQLNQIVDDNTTVIGDVGCNYMWMARYYLSYQPHRLLFSNGQQTLGVALPWAMATTLARPNEKVISISGDGGFLFSATELETAVREKMNLVHFVWCDGYYDMVREQQLMKYNRETAVKLGPVDIVKFAESFGAKGFKVNSSDYLVKIMKEALSTVGPVLVEVSIDYSDNPELFLMANKHLIGH